MADGPILPLALPQGSDADYAPIIARVSALVQGITGVQLGARQEAMVKARVTRRMLALGMDQPAAYLAHLSAHEAEERTALVSLLTTHHTYFFREFDQLRLLIERVVPAAVESLQKRGRRHLRIWSMACSRGHEVYSLAMLLHRHLPTIAPGFTFEIFGTDVDPESVAVAAAGVYRYDEIKEVPALYLDNHFSRGTGAIASFVKARASLRQVSRFAVANLLELDRAEVGGSFDVLFCRNVFIYFNDQQIRAIANSMVRHLSEHGALFIGLSESLGNLGVPLTYLGQSLYVRPESPLARRSTPASLKASSQQAAPVLRVLAVDDSPTVVAILKAVLTRENGFEVVATAANGKEAAELLKRHAVDVMTLDVHMPELDGPGYLEAHFRPGHPPVVMVSAIERDDIGRGKRCLSLGASDYVEKPDASNLVERGEELRTKLRCAYEARNNATPAPNSPQRTPVLAPKNPGPPEPTLLTPGAQAKVGATGERIELRCREPVLLSILAPKLKRGAFVTWNGTAAESFAARVTATIAALGSPAELELKLLGRAAEIERAEGVLKGRGLKLATRKSLPAGPFEVRLNCQQSRLQVASADDSHPRSKPTPAAASEGAAVKVLIVDDSATMRQLLRGIFDRESGLTVVGEAERPSQVEELIRRHKPDVITLDVNLPEMDGVTLVGQLMPRHQLPIVMISALSMNDGDQILRALELGAVDYIQKPALGELRTVAPMICDKVKTAAKAKIRRAATRPRTLSSSLLHAGTLARADSRHAIVLGASTGGTEALREILVALPAVMPPILIVQHIPPVFSAAFAQRLATVCKLAVKEAEDGDELRPGLVLIAPGGRHLEIVRATTGNLSAKVYRGANVTGHCPSVDVLFHSAAKALGKQAIAGILTGMGKDGAAGLLAIRNAGGQTLGQDQATSVVYGMPQAAAVIGAVERVLPLDEFASSLLHWAAGSSDGRRALG